MYNREALDNKIQEFSVGIQKGLSRCFEDRHGVPPLGASGLCGGDP